MRELLEGGNQIVCDDFDDLKKQVSYVLSHPELGEKGFEYARQFTVERFNSEWVHLIERLNEDG
jgi:hypothetical protein